MRNWSNPAVFLALLIGGGCATGPTEQEIIESLERTLRSAAGDWHGRTFGANPLALDFRLREDTNGKIAGAGSMKDARTGAVLPFTVSGSYRRPILALTFIGLRYEGARVQGTLEGSYTTVGGVSTSLHLTAPGLSETVTILLQEE